MSKSTPAFSLPVTIALGRLGEDPPALVLACAAAHARTGWPVLPHGAFLEFARLPPSAEAAQSFAQRHGWLEQPSQDYVVEGFPAGTRAEPVQAWLAASRRLQRWVAIWEALQTPEDVDRHIAAVDAALVGNRHDLAAALPDPDGHRAWIREWDKADETGQADNLYADAPALLTYGISAELATLHAVEPLGLQFGQDRRWALIPRTLHQALWVAFAQMVARGGRLKACIVCGTWFEVGPGKHSKNRQFCSHRCKLRHYRA